MSGESMKLHIPGRHTHHDDDRGMPRGRTRGRSAPAGVHDPADLGPFADLVKATLRHEVQVEEARGGEGEAPPLEVSPSSVLELELEGGITWWTTADSVVDLVARAPAQQRGGGFEAEDGSFRLPATLPFGTPTRGLGGLAVRFFRLFDVDLPERSAVELADLLEGRLEPGPGLYLCPRPDDLGKRLESADEVPGGGPLLVFLHGTASTTDGSFGKLASEEGGGEWERLRQRYGSRILAFEHRTLSQGPEENALELAKLLPEGAEVHLVSHSRGGLVGELLCRGSFSDPRRPPFTDSDLEPFGDEATQKRLEELGLHTTHGEGAEILAARRRARQTLADLGDVLAAKRLRLTRFVRVACPARGTLLASERLDRYLSAMLSALGLVPGFGQSPVYHLVKAFLVAVVEERTRPETLPGLEAMMPSSPLVHLLNVVSGSLDADLTVIAGDLEGRGVFGRLKTFVTDLFFRSNHDLVVDSAAMYGGGPRVGGRARFLFVQGAEVNHFTYFLRDESAGALLRALEAGGGAPSGFRELVVGDPPREVRGLGTFAGVKAPGEVGGERPVAVLLPGIMGSRLAVGGDVVWIDAPELMLGGMAQLAMGADVDPADPLAIAYGDLVHHLARSHDVVPFAYDWRRSLDHAAGELAAAVGEILQKTDRPVRFVAHSMGGLVVRRLRLGHRDLWNRLRERDGFRFLMLGTPNGGSYTIAEILLGRQKALRKLALLDIHHGVHSMLDLVGDFPGVLQLLPPRDNPVAGNGDAGDLFDAATWSAWRAIDDRTRVPAQAELDTVRSMRRELDDDDLDDPAILYLAGQSERTPLGVEVRRDGRGRQRLAVVAGRRGDGQVLWDLGIPEALSRGGRVWYAPGVSHGDLAREEALFPVIDDLLERGSTARDAVDRDEPATPFGTRGAGAETVAGAEEIFEEPQILPTFEELALAAVGVEEEAPSEEPEGDSLRVWVSHGSLLYARGPVAVGHYDGDVLASAEAVVDHYVLGGALRERQRLGLYPGPERTADAVLHPDDPRRGALVVGLGRVGELAVGKIEDGVRLAVLHYALAVAGLERWDDLDEDGRRRVTVSALLIGSGEGTGVSIGDSVRALVSGAAEAVRALRGDGRAERVRLAALEVVELYERRAVCAAEALQRLAGGPSPVAGVRLDAEDRLHRIDGGQRDLSCVDADWWRRLQVTEEPSRGGTGDGAGDDDGDGFGTLKFVTLSDRAVAPVRLLPTQGKLVDQFVKRSIHDTSWNADMARTLFELLVPNALKQGARDERDLLLVLDSAAAHYPWELLVDGLNEHEPLSVRAGMLRQLADPDFRPEPILPRNDDALVVGDPPTGSPSYPRLPGAQKEAEEVARRLRDGGFAVKPLIGEVPESILPALYAGGHRVLHLAAHGEYVPGHPERSGVLLADGMLLTANEFEQMRLVPELVFVNCCKLGRIDAAPESSYRHLNRLAANVGLQLIRMGVRAVVAAGWLVDDDAALTFADRLYAGLLDGEKFGDAVLAARRRTYHDHPGSNTFGAYQCYGDPEYRLVDRSRRRAGETGGWVDPVRLIGELGNIRSRARTGSRPTRLRREIESLEGRVEEHHPGWMRRGDVAQAFGDAWAEISGRAAWDRAMGGGETGDGGGEEARQTARLATFDRALPYLRAAVLSAEGEVALGTVADLANLETRSAVVAWRRDREAAGGLEEGSEERLRVERRMAAAVDRVRGVVERLQGLGHGFNDAERWSALGRASERLGAMAPEERPAAVDRAREAYDRAYELSAAGDTGAVLHPLGQRCLYRALGRILATASQDEEMELHLARLEARRSPSFRDTVAVADAALVRLLLRHSLDRAPGSEPGRVAIAYAAARERGGSPRQLASVVEHLDSLVDLLDDRWPVAEEGTGRAISKAAAQRCRAARSELLTVRRELVSLLGRGERG